MKQIMDEKKRSEYLKNVSDSLTEEQKEKAKACKTVEELTEMLTEAGVELSDELLDAVAGGWGKDLVFTDPPIIFKSR